jgi:hypothetical protein
MMAQAVHPGYYSAQSLQPVHKLLATIIQPTNLGPIQVLVSQFIRRYNNSNVTDKKHLRVELIYTPTRPTPIFTK